MSDHRVGGYGTKHLAEVSHGESFLQVAGGRFDRAGLYLLDEPDAPLSYESCLVLMKQIQRVEKLGGQVICATHSPLLSALPNARILQLSDRGIERLAWAQLCLVRNWRNYLANPQAVIDAALTSLGS